MVPKLDIGKLSIKEKLCKLMNYPSGGGTYDENG
jgi:hypothetical protein